MICAPTLGLGPIHRQVSAPFQRLAVVAVDRSDGDADARADENAMAIDFQRFGDLLHYPFGKVGRVFRSIESTRQNGKFVAGETSKKVAFAQTSGQLLAYLLQDGVAGRVAERIVHALEIVETDIKDADRLPISNTCLHFLQTSPKRNAIG